MLFRNVLKSHFFLLCCEWHPLLIFSLSSLCLDLVFDTSRPTAFASFGANATSFLQQRLLNKKPRLGGNKRNTIEREVILETTPVPLYTGILVWVFCDYESTETVFTQRGIPIRVHFCSLFNHSLVCPCQKSLQSFSTRSSKRWLQQS